ncbi:MAG: hypothetical protein ACRETQ_12340 [Gammaproteobacteria bacterium]
MNADAAGLTSFREQDGLWQARKGTTFRAFKRALPELVEGVDFVYLNAGEHPAEIERLRAAQRIYASSVNVVLLAASGVRKLARL